MAPMRPFLNYFGRTKKWTNSSTFGQIPFLICDFAVWTAKMDGDSSIFEDFFADEPLSSTKEDGRILKFMGKE